MKELVIKSKYIKIGGILSAALVVILFCLCLPSRVEAAWNANNIISDSEMTAYSTMSEEQIQNFLISKNSFLANYLETQPNYMGVPEREPAQGRRAAYIIWWVSNEYKINPQVILTTLQKEQGIIDSNTPPLGQHSIDYAMGYGCPDGSTCADYPGFSRQVDWGAWQLRFNQSHANNSWVYPNYDSSKFLTSHCPYLSKNWVSPYYTGNTYNVCFTYGSSSCAPTYFGNGATASLYRYTPYFHGNQLFYSIYTSWFNRGEYVHSNTKVTTSLVLSNYSPAIGETIDATYRITNISSSPLTYDYIGISNRLGSIYGPGYDFGWYQNITINPGATYIVSKSIILTEAGTYGTWAAYVVNGIFYYANPETNQAVSAAFIAHIPNITVTVPLAVNTSYPITNQAANYTITFLNREPKRIYFANIGIMGVKLEDMSSRDIHWTSNSYIEPNASLAISANVALPSAHYSEWPAIQIGGAFYNIYLDGAPSGRVNVLNIEVPGPGFAHKVTTSLALSNSTPAIGELITATYEITNTSPSPVTLSYVGVSNRLGGYYGAGYDLGWDQNITIAAGATYPVSVAAAVTIPGTYSYWAAYVLNGVFYYAIPQTNQITQGTFIAHIPNITVTVPLAVNTSYPIANQAANYTITFLNREPKRIYFANIGIMGVKLEDMSSRDIHWTSNSYIEPNASLAISANVALPSAHYSEWPAIQIGGAFYNIYLDGAPSGRVNVLNIEVPGPGFAHKVTTSLTLSNSTPAIGELITATYEITNTSPSPVTLSYVGVSNRLGGYYGAGYDLGWDQNITIAAGATYPVSVAAAVTIPGTYSYWAAYVLNGVFYYAIPQTNQTVAGTFIAH